MKTIEAPLTRSWAAASPVRLRRGYPIPLPGIIAPIPGGRAMVRRKTARLLPGSLKGTDEIAGFQFLREQDHLLAWAAELLDVLVHDTADLALQRRVFLALAVRRKRDRANDGLVLVVAQIFCDGLLVERPRRLDGLLDQLTAGVAERRKIVDQRLNLGFRGPLRIGLEERLGPVVIHALFREP